MIELSITSRQMAFFQSYPERFYFEGLLESVGASVPTLPYLPIYFGNVCLRFLPVSAFDSLSPLKLFHAKRGLLTSEMFCYDLGVTSKCNFKCVTYIYIFSSVHSLTRVILTRLDAKSNLLDSGIYFNRTTLLPMIFRVIQKKIENLRIQDRTRHVSVSGLFLFLFWKGIS